MTIYSTLLVAITIFFAVATRAQQQPQELLKRSVVGSSYENNTRPGLPLQLEMRVPFEPTSFPNSDRKYLVYELYLTNLTTRPVSLRRIDVLSAEGPSVPPIASFAADRLETMMRSLGRNSNQRGTEVPAGTTTVVFMFLTFDRGSQIPGRLFHRVVTTDSVGQGASIATHHTNLHVLGPPVEGADWLAADATSNDPDNHHRRGILMVDGQATISRRYAVDWKQVKNGASFAGNPRDVHSYYAYEKEVLAVADGRVITARDGLPENTPGHGEDFHPLCRLR